MIDIKWFETLKKFLSGVPSSADWIIAQRQPFWWSTCFSAKRTWVLIISEASPVIRLLLYD